MSERGVRKRNNKAERSFVLSELIRKVAIWTYDMIPEGPLKHTVRAAASKVNGELSRRAYVNCGDIVVQVGTPSTGMVRYLLEIVGPKGRVIVIEPEKNNFQNLKSDPVIASARNVVLLNKGAWSRHEKIALTVSKNEADHKIAVAGVVHDNDYVPGNYMGMQKIEVATVDNILEALDYTYVDFVDIAVNGAELEVLKGMKRIMKHRVRLRIKAHAKEQASGDDIGRKILAICKEKGFRTTRARRTAARTEATEWGPRMGDVYAAKLT